MLQMVSMTYHIKSLRVLLSLSLCAFATNAFCVTVTSSELKIWGGWTENWVDQNGEQRSSSDTFGSVSTTSPTLGLNVVSAPNGLNNASSTIDSFNLSMAAYSSPWGGAIQGASIGIHSEATTILRAEYSGELVINLSGRAFYNYYAWEQDLQVILRDLTSSTVVLNVKDLDGSYSPWQIEQTFNVVLNPSHEYSFTILGNISAFAAKDAYMELHADLMEVAPTPVPDKGITSLLLAMSLLTVVSVDTLFRHC